jgi:hypothetical protein
VVEIKSDYESWDDATRAIDEGEINPINVKKVIIYYDE